MTDRQIVERLLRRAEINIDIFDGCKNIIKRKPNKEFLESLNLLNDYDNRISEQLEFKTYLMKQLDIETQKEMGSTELKEEHLGKGSLEQRLAYEEELRREIEEKSNSYMIPKTYDYEENN